MDIAWSKTAKESLKATLRNIKKNFGDSVAREIRQEIESQTSMLSLQPMMGKEDVEHSSDDRRFRYIIVKRRSRIYYLLEDHTIHVLLVWDVRQDIQQLKQVLEKFK